MKIILTYSLFLLSVISCDLAPPKSQQRTMGNGEKNQETSLSINYDHVIDSLSRIKSELELELSALKKQFDYKQQNLRGKSYYHKNWRGKYYIADQGILAGVDSIGNFFLIANVWTYSYFNANLDSIQISLDTTSYFAKSDPSFSLAKPPEVVCACGFHQAYFTGAHAQLIGQEVSRNQDKEITWMGITTLTKRDKVGIKETFDLSEKLGLIFDIEYQLEQINKLL